MFFTWNKPEPGKTGLLLLKGEVGGGPPER
jgi:hypothetical protein